MKSILYPAVLNDQTVQLVYIKEAPKNSRNKGIKYHLGKRRGK